MSAKPKNRLCWNCEGNISIYEQHCFFCGASLNPQFMPEDTEKNNPFAPPYTQICNKNDNTIPLAPYAKAQRLEMEQQTDFSASKKLISQDEPENTDEEDVKNVTLPLIQLLAGSIFLLFSLALLLFSQNGVFTLQWNGAYWFVYLFLAIPMLIFGWRSLRAVQ